MAAFASLRKDFGLFGEDATNGKKKIKIFKKKIFKKKKRSEGHISALQQITRYLSCMSLPGLQNHTSAFMHVKFAYNTRMNRLKLSRISRKYVLFFSV
jgi:hypothetical protein